MSLNVLVVDDSSVARKVIAKCIRLADLPVGELHEAANGQEGLDILDKHWVDLALVDINMPVMNGEEMIERVRSSPELRELPIIVISTEGSETRIERLEQKGVTFVHKPFTPETIREVAERITGISYERNRLHAALSRVATDVFEELAMMLLVSEDEPRETPSPSLVVAGISFEGPFSGRLVASVPESMLPALASNMLGLEDGTDAPPDKQQDALKELVNVVCGNLLPAVAGSKAIFNVNAPEFLADGVRGTPDEKSVPATAARVRLQEGSVELKLFIEGELPAETGVPQAVEVGAREEKALAQCSEQDGTQAGQDR